MKKKSKIGKKIVFILNIAPYSQEVVVVCNGQFSDAVKEIKKHKTLNAKLTIKHIEERKDDYKDEHKKGTGKLYTELPAGYVMLIDHQNSWIESVGTITHESLHLTHYILHRAGIVLNAESEEAFTYLTEKTVEEILKRIY